MARLFPFGSRFLMNGNEIRALLLAVPDERRIGDFDLADPVGPLLACTAVFLGACFVLTGLGAIIHC